MKTFLFGRTAGRKTAGVIERSAPPPHFSWLVLPVVVLLVASLTACGVKNDLVKPNGQPTPRSERDPSLPPTPTGSR